MKRNLHVVIVVPGLGDVDKAIAITTGFWKLFGLTPIVFPMEWKLQTNNFQSKLKKLISLIDTEVDKGNKVSLLGTSAGASIVLNAFIQRTKSIHKVVNVCGRLRPGPSIGFRSFANMTKGFPSFAESVITSGKNESKLNINDRKRIMTIRPLFGDQYVPKETVYLNGAKNITIPTVEHSSTIAMCLTFLSGTTISFLKS